MGMKKTLNFFFGMKNFAYFFRLATKILIPVSFFVIATWPGSYWLAGVMTILTLFYYLLVWQKIGVSKFKEDSE